MGVGGVGYPMIKTLLCCAAAAGSMLDAIQKLFPRHNTDPDQENFSTKKWRTRKGNFESISTTNGISFLIVSKP